MEQGLDYDKLLLQTDPLVKALATEIELFHGGDQIEIAIKNAPDITNPINREWIENVTQEFENIDYGSIPIITEIMMFRSWCERNYYVAQRVYKLCQSNRFLP